MIQLFEIGAKKTFTKIVQTNETATFESGEVHPFYATFALGKDAEWVCRLFVLEMKEPHEEGIGTFLNITHLSPALVNNQVVFEATLEEINGNEVICSFTTKVGDRLVASGKTGQKILKKEKLERLIEQVS
jgi:fluoroacetyl-CoA thioesterase